MSAHSIRYHSSDDMAGLGELADTMEPCAVVIRPGGSVDVYGYIGVVDQRPEPPEADRIAAALAVARTYGQIAGDHHKTWVIEQITAALEGRPADATRGTAP